MLEYLNNRIEQDHRFIKKLTKPMLGFKAFHSAQATLAGIEVAHTIRKKQLSQNGTPAYQQFIAQKLEMVSFGQISIYSTTPKK
jgi:putative transposase